MSSKKIGASLIPAIIAIAFVAVALTFGMGEWRQVPATASTPAAVSPN